MPVNIFKSKKSSTPKGKTTKKGEPIDNRQTRRDTHVENSASSKSAVNLVSVDEWLKENAVEGPEPAERKERAGLWELKGPRLPTLILGAARKECTATKEAASDESGLPNGKAGPTINDSDGKEQERQVLDLLVGHQDASSHYFTRTYFRVPASSTSATSSPPFDNGDALHRLPELDPHAFRLYQIWLHTGAILPGYHGVHDSVHTSTSKYKWQIFWPLINAHVLGCAINAFDFADQVIDFLQGKLGNTTCADIDTINHLFSSEHKDISNALKCFVVDRCIDASVEGTDNMSLANLPLAFGHLIAERALKRLCSDASTSTEPDCRYHMHETPESCYKKNISPKETKKQQWLEHDREKSRKDGEEVVTNAKANGIETVDWEERKAEANQALMDQTGKKWIGFSRLSDRQRPAPTVNTGPSPSPGELFGTAQSNGAVDDVLTKTPSLGTPQPRSGLLNY